MLNRGDRDRISKGTPGVANIGEKIKEGRHRWLGNMKRNTEDYGNSLGIINYNIFLRIFVYAHEH